MPTDIQFKHVLRTELSLLEKLVELANEEKIDELVKEAEARIDIINDTLSD